MSLERRLALHVAKAHPTEAARALEPLETGVAAAVLDELEPAHGAPVLGAMAPSCAAAVLAAVSVPRGAELLSAAPAPVAVWLLRRLSENHRTVLLEALEPRRRRRLARALTAREGTAGAIVDPDALTFRADLAVRDALDRHGEALIGASHALPVVDDEHRLVGMVRLEDLRTSERSRTIASIMLTRFSSVPAHFERRGIVAHPGWRNATALPVIDGGGVFLGMLRYGDLRALERELSGSTGAPDVSTSQALGEVFGTAVGGFFEALIAFSGGGRNDARES